MNDDFYASIKLVSGEEIFAITSSEDDTLIIQDPVCIESIHGPRGSYLRIEPWMQVPKDQFYFIDKSKIITGKKGKYKRSSKSNVKGARKKGATLRDWFEKEDWRRVDDPSKKCGE